MQILENHTNTACSARKGSLGGGKMRDNGDLTLLVLPHSRNSETGPPDCCHKGAPESHIGGVSKESS
jgi:hypothetical protein